MIWYILLHAFNFFLLHQKYNVVVDTEIFIPNTLYWLSALPEDSAVARVSEAPPEISRGAPHTLLAYYYELQ